MSISSLSSFCRLVNLRLCKQSFSSVHNTTSLSRTPAAKLGYRISTRKYLSWTPAAKLGYRISTRNYGINRQRRAHRTIKMDSNAVDLSRVSTPSGFNLPEWSNWFLLAIPAVIVPFLANGKWGPLLDMKSKLSKALEQVDDAAEVIEHVARTVDKIADDITEKIPDGKFKQIIQRIDEVAEETIKAADCVEEILQKVDEVEEKIDEIIKDTTAAKDQAQVGVSTTKVVQGN